MPGRAVGERADRDVGRHARAQVGQDGVDRVDRGDDVGAGLAADVEDDRRLGPDERAEPGVLRAVDDGGDVLQVAPARRC